MIVTCCAQVTAEFGVISLLLQNLQQSQRALLSVPNSAQGILTTLMIIISHIPRGHTGDIVNHELTFGVKIALGLVLHPC